MKILFLPNWTVVKSDTDITDLQAPDKYICGKPYWFFTHFPENTHVDVIDIQVQNRLHPIEKKIKFYIWQAILAFKKAKQYDVVISHGAQSGLVYALLSRFRKKENRPLHIIIDVGAMNGGRDNRIETFIIKQALKSHPAVIYHASIQQKFYETVFKGLIKRSQFIPFGVNTEEFYPLDLPTEDYVLSFGYSKRDYPTLLDAWQDIDTSTRLYILGDTSIIGRDNIVSLPKSSVSVLKQYIAGSLFVVIPLPVFNYSYGQMSFLQSMAMGKPVIVTKTPGSIDYLQNAQGAFLVNPYDKADMKDKIEYLLAHKEQLSDLGNKAWNDIKNCHFDEQTMADKIYAFIKTLI
jgi:glycosyltransferase involved in cell wall biosynthesis